MYQRRMNKPRRVIHSIDELPAICDCCDVGLYLRLNPEVAARMARDGVINGAKQGQSWRFRKADIAAYENKLFEGGREGTACEGKGSCQTGKGLFRSRFQVKKRRPYQRYDEAITASLSYHR